jgi:hypothetical protein
MRARVSATAALIFWFATPFRMIVFVISTNSAFDRIPTSNMYGFLVSTLNRRSKSTIGGGSVGGTTRNNVDLIS